MTQESLSKRYKSLLLLSSLALVLLFFMVASIGTAYYFYRKSLDSVDIFAGNTVDTHSPHYQHQKLTQGYYPKHPVSRDDSDYKAQPESTDKPVYDDYELPAPLDEMMVGDRKSKVNTAFIKYNADIQNNDTTPNKNVKNNDRKTKILRKVDKNKDFQQDDASAYNADNGKYTKSKYDLFKEAHNNKIMECLNLTYPIILVSKLETQLQLADMKPHKQRQYRKEMLERLYRHDYNENISAGMRVVTAMTHYLSLTNDLDGLYLFVELVKELSKVADDSSIYTNLEKGFKYSKSQQTEVDVEKGSINDRRRTNRETKNRKNKNKHKNKNEKINETKIEKELEEDLKKLQKIDSNHPKSFENRHNNYKGQLKENFKHDDHNGETEYDTFNRVVDSIHNNDNYNNKNDKTRNKNKGRFEDNKKQDIKNSHYKLNDHYDLYGGKNSKDNYIMGDYNGKHIDINSANHNEKQTNKNFNPKNNFQGFHNNGNYNSYMYNNNKYDSYDRNRYPTPRGNLAGNHALNYHRWNNDGKKKQWREDDKFNVVGNNMIGTHGNDASYKNNNIFYHDYYTNNGKNVNSNRNNYFHNTNTYRQNYQHQNGHLNDKNTGTNGKMYQKDPHKNTMYFQPHKNLNQFNSHENTVSNYFKSNKDYQDDGIYKQSYNEHRYAITNRPTYMNYDPKPLTNHHHLGNAYRNPHQFYNYPFQANNGHNNANRQMKNERTHEKSEIEAKKEKLDKIITDYLN